MEKQQVAILEGISNVEGHGGGGINNGRGTGRLDVSCEMEVGRNV
jgi:hypothetical protein